MTLPAESHEGPTDPSEVVSDKHIQRSAHAAVLIAGRVC